MAMRPRTWACNRAAKSCGAALPSIQTPPINAQCVVSQTTWPSSLTNIMIPTQMPQRPAAPSIPAAVAPPTAPALVQVDSDSDSSQPGPAILISPVKAQAVKRGIANKSDKDVWSLPDNDIIGVWLFPPKK